MLPYATYGLVAASIDGRRQGQGRLSAVGCHFPFSFSLALGVAVSGFWFFKNMIPYGKNNSKGTFVL
jgi:hypothetical protein